MKRFAYITSLALAASASGIAISPLFIGGARLFEPGLGACGTTMGPNDPVVAISTNQFANGSHCSQWVNITDITDGSSAFGRVEDVCPSCSDNDIDMNVILFEELDPFGLGDGVIEVQWIFEPFGFTPPI